MKTENETKLGQPRTEDGDPNPRPKADTIVTEGAQGLARLRRLTRVVLKPSARPGAIQPP